MKVQSQFFPESTAPQAGFLFLTMLDIIRSSDTKALGKLLRARTTTLAEAEAVVRPILEDIRRHGDRALLRYAKKFDRLDLRQTGFTVTREGDSRRLSRGSRRLCGGGAGGGGKYPQGRAPAIAAAVDVPHSRRRSASGRSSGRWSAWRATFPAGAFRCPPPC